MRIGTGSAPVINWWQEAARDTEVVRARAGQRPRRVVNAEADEKPSGQARTERRCPEWLPELFQDTRRRLTGREEPVEVRLGMLG